MLQEPAFGLLLDPGLGKTSITLAAFDILKKEGIVDHLLVIAPLRVAYDTWPEEIAKWKDFNHLTHTILHGPKKEERLTAFKHDVYLMNPEGMSWFCDTEKRKGRKKVAHRKLQGRWMLVVDESTKFKHTNTARFKDMKRIMDHFDRRYILTGTPVPNGYEDLFGQVYILDAGARLGEYITHYRNRFFMPDFASGGHRYDIRDDQAVHDIQELVGDIVLRLDAEDYLDMPPLIFKNIGVDLGKHGRALYDQLEEEMVLELADGEVTAANAGVLSSKLRQAANGRVYMDADGNVLVADGEEVPKGKREVAFIHKAKVEAVSDLVDELEGQPLIIAYEFRHDLDALQEEFGFDVPVLGAGTTPARGRKITGWWNDGSLPLLLAHPASAGWGLNLQDGGHHLGFYSSVWNLEHYEQLYRRQWRQGQRFPVFVYNFVAKHTIDVHVADVRQDKDATQKDLLEAFKRSLK